jgi:quinolinate synthase
MTTELRKNNINIPKMSNDLFHKIILSNNFNKTELDSLKDLILEIEELKLEMDAVVMAHFYAGENIIYSVADYASDSYDLALKARDFKAKNIVLAGVKFMAETAKLVSPKARVLLPDVNSGCSLAKSVTVDMIKEAKQKYPNAPVVTYMNTSAEIKAVSDVCVTSSNAFKILNRMNEKEIIFTPDKLMAKNLQNEFNDQKIVKKLISVGGACEVHEQFETKYIHTARKEFPDIQILSHPECPEQVICESDFSGSTSQIVDYAKKSKNKHFMVMTECGLVNQMKHEIPNKEFITPCVICPHMKLNSLEKIRDVLKSPRKENIIEIDENIRKLALKPIERMFELAK